MSGMSSLKVYSGGLVGSGKLVQLNGLVSSKNWTRHTNVAMAHPCKCLPASQAARVHDPSARLRSLVTTTNPGRQVRRTPLSREEEGGAEEELLEL